MSKLCFTLAGIVGISASAVAADYTIHSWKKIQLDNHFWAEGATIGDFNRDGKKDVIAGPYWWEGPDFKKRHQFMSTTRKSPAGEAPFKKKTAGGSEEAVEGFEGALGEKNTYSDNFFAFTYDFNKDGWDDVMIYGFPGMDASWYENPGKTADANLEWKRHLVFDVVDNESPTFTDITGDGKPEIVCSSDGVYGYA